MGVLAVLGKWAAYTALMKAVRASAEAKAKESARLKKMDRDLNFLQLWDLSENESFGLLKVIQEPHGIICKCRYVTDEWYSEEITKEVFWDEDDKPALKYMGKFLYINIEKCTPKGKIPEIFWAWDREEALLKYCHAESARRNRFVFDPIGDKRRSK